MNLHHWRNVLNESPDLSNMLCTCYLTLSLFRKIPILGACSASFFRPMNLLQDSSRGGCYVDVIGMPIFRELLRILGGSLDSL